MTQIVFDLDHLDRFFDGSAAPRRSRCWSASSRSASYRLALRLHNELPGIVVPEALQERARATRGRTRPRSGWRPRRSCTRPPRSARRGVYLVAPYRQPLNILNLIA